MRTPLPRRPGKIVCVGLNYQDHAAEAGLPAPERPLLFAKWPTALIGPGDPIVLPAETDQVDFEAELGLVIGREARDVTPDDALGVLAGAVCLNDVTARDIQTADGQWTRSKSFDSFCPVGPRVVPIEELGDITDLQIRCLLNGEVVQESRTSEMIFSIPDIIAYASRATTLQPGDLIATGTPSGVGAGRTPPLFLKDGDVVSVEIENIGALSNPVARDAPVDAGLLSGSESQG